MNGWSATLLLPDDYKYIQLPLILQQLRVQSSDIVINSDIDHSQQTGAFPTQAINFVE